MVGQVYLLPEYRLTTAEILYLLPDHPRLLQTFIWQDLDIAPEFPALRRFLDFWGRELDGKLHGVRIASAKIGGGINFADHQFRLH